MRDKDYFELFRRELGLGEDEPLIFTRYDEGGTYWHFEVESEKFGRLVCSYYPAQALQTLRNFFEQHLLDHPRKAESVELILDHAEEIFPKHIYALFKDAIRQAVHEIISRTRWELRGVTHTLTPSTEKESIYKELADRVLQPAKEAAIVRMGLPTGGRTPELSDIQKEALPGLYRQRLADSQKVKEFYDHQFEQFEKDNRRNGYEWEKWEGVWLPLAKERFPSFRLDYLALFSSPDKPSAADVTHQWLAKKLRCAPSYIEKIISGANKE